MSWSAFFHAAGRMSNPSAERAPPQVPSSVLLLYGAVKILCNDCNGSGNCAEFIPLTCRKSNCVEFMPTTGRKTNCVEFTPLIGRKTNCVKFMPWT
jgi:hypothetical protein